jgi:hypothetical protein
MKVPFPIKGVNEGWAFGQQPEGTSPDALNVLPIDVQEDRIRGGQRWGLTKYFEDEVGGT